MVAWCFQPNVDIDTMIQNDQNTDLNVGELTKITTTLKHENQGNIMKITIYSLMNFHWIGAKTCFKKWISHVQIVEKYSVLVM